MSFSSKRVSGERVLMSASERVAAQSISAVFALRMLGLFLVLPVFALEVRELSGGDDVALMGFAIGVYGLAQAVFQVPLGIASDRFGRKPVIVLGLLVFVIGSVIAALADSVWVLILGRAVQGAGAISAAAVALLADLTRDSVRTRAMALLGISIGAVFAISLAVAPLINAAFGFSSIFWLTAVLACLSILLVLFVTPDVKVSDGQRSSASGEALSFSGLLEIVFHADLWRLHFSIFALHAVQMALWCVIPSMLVSAGLVKSAHWQLYLPAVFVSFLLLGGVFSMERRGKLIYVIRGSVLLLLAVALVLWFAGGDSVYVMFAAIFGFFVSFNALEATLPSLLSKKASQSRRGAALGVFNTLQSVGLFVGGAFGGLLLRSFGQAGVFVAALVVTCVWAFVCWNQNTQASS